MFKRILAVAFLSLSLFAISTQKPAIDPIPECYPCPDAR
jgi:hypothetical protein